MPSMPVPGELLDANQVRLLGEQHCRSGMPLAEGDQVLERVIRDRGVVQRKSGTQARPPLLAPERHAVCRAKHPHEAVTGFEERIYELGAAALADQERQVAEVRGRGSTLLAAGVLIASLLAKPVFHDGHPRGTGEIAATAVGLVGMAGVLLFVVLLLRPYQLGFSVRAGATYGALWDQGIVEQPMVDLALADAFEERRNQNAKVVVERLVLFLALTLASLLLEAAGLAAATLRSAAAQATLAARGAPRANRPRRFMGAAIRRLQRIMLT